MVIDDFDIVVLAFSISIHSHDSLHKKVFLVIGIMKTEFEKVNGDLSMIAEER